MDGVDEGLHEEVGQRASAPHDGLRSSASLWGASRASRMVASIARSLSRSWHPESLPLRRNLIMIYYALVFLIVGLVAGALGLAGVAEVSAQIAWILFLIGIVFLVIHMVRGRTPPAL